MTTTVSLEDIFEATSRLRSAIGQSIFGQDDLITHVLCCLFSGGHVLMTGAPGLAKTTLVRVISRHLSLASGRIQFTPDLLPTDIIGTDVLNIDAESNKRTFEFSQGPIFTNLLLADEINRASPRTQSALLEAMQERNCTVGGEVHKLPYPFMVFATQNPFDSEGTFPLPEAQLDRFLAHINVSYPSQETEERILKEHAESRLVGENLGDGQVNHVLSKELVCQIIEKSKSIVVEQPITKAIVELIRSSRPDDPLCPQDLREKIWYGAGPRAGISLISMAKSLALLNGHEIVRWQHIRQSAPLVLCHRVRITVHAGRDRISEGAIVDELIDRLEEKFKFLAKGVN